MKELEQAQKLLLSGTYTCVLCKDDQTLTSTQRGVKPLVSWLEAGSDLAGGSAADKVVGKATAFLYVLLGVKAVYAQVISRSALQVLESCGIFAQYGSQVENIINRAGDGICPFEAAVLDIDEPRAAYTAIRKKMEQMGITIG